ncbi:hypothetical protein GN956_G8383 [Arapaima gigas]
MPKRREKEECITYGTSERPLSSRLLRGLSERRGDETGFAKHLKFGKCVSTPWEQTGSGDEEEQRLSGKSQRRSWPRQQPPGAPLRRTPLVRRTPDETGKGLR